MKPSEKFFKKISTILFWWTLIVITGPNFVLSFTENMPIAGRLANVLLPLGCWGYCLCLSRNVGRSVLLMFPLMFFGAFQIVLLHLYGRSVIAVDMFLNVVTTNAAEVGELLGNMAFAIGIVVIMYLPPIIAAICLCVEKVRIPESTISRCRKPFFLTAIAGLCCIVAAYSGRQGYAVENDLFPVNALYNVGLAVDRSVKSESISNEGYRYHAISDSSHKGREVYVLIVGETSRADHWQLNGYGRKTNAELPDSVFISYSKVLSESNTTHKSVPMLLSHLSSETFGDSIYHVKSIITAFKEAGFRTAFFSNQRYNHSFIDRFGFEADTAVFIKEAPDAPANPNDLALLPLLENEINQGYDRQLIVLHTYGSHFSYKDRYEGMNPMFTPDYPVQARKSLRKELINAYDNSICVTSKLIADVAGMLEKDNVPAAILYTADHGEDIFDDYRDLFLHASPVPSVYQIHVPMVIWFNNCYRQRYPDICETALSNRNANISSSKAYAQTALQMAGIRTTTSDTTQSVLSKGYKEPARVYLSDHNKSVRLRRAGMDDIDFEVLRSYGISED